ncbi:unnamed protein product [Meganyctiphanes norvegica]|uniref:Uncharacterized protein n=1 Tax=Meganyctiphanes norvegica TaxID=48144 RepID=A0AAV2STH2_MEGNR
MKAQKHLLFLNSQMYEIMFTYNSGKDGVIFKEKADEMKHATLTNKRKQETRGGEEIAECAKSGDLTSQKLTQRILDRLIDHKILIFGIGLAQILEKYARTSLDSQMLANFTTTVYISCQGLVSYLEQLFKAWEWEISELKMAGIGIPAQLVKNFVEKSTLPMFSKEPKLLPQQELI